MDRSKFLWHGSGISAGSVPRGRKPTSLREKAASSDFRQPMAVEIRDQYINAALADSTFTFGGGAIGIARTNASRAFPDVSKVKMSQSYVALVWWGVTRPERHLVSECPLS
jgi:hypothetical protein